MMKWVLVLEARTVLSAMLHFTGFSKKGWIIPLPSSVKNTREEQELCLQILAWPSADSSGGLTRQHYSS